MPLPTCSAASACAQVLLCYSSKGHKSYVVPHTAASLVARERFRSVHQCDNVEPCDSGLLVLFFSKKRKQPHRCKHSWPYPYEQTQRKRERSIMNVLQRLIDLKINRVCIHASIQTLLNCTRSLLHIILNDG